MIILDFFCKKCGNQKDEVVVKNSEEVITCEQCNETMDRLFSKTKYNFRPTSGTQVPTKLLGRGNERARFGKFK